MAKTYTISLEFISDWVCSHFFTGNFFSEALILAFVNPQYDERSFIELQEKYKFRTCCVQKLFFCFDIQNNICTQHGLNLYFYCNSINDLLSDCGLIDSRMRASDTDLPVARVQRVHAFVDIYS